MRVATCSQVVDWTFDFNDGNSGPSFPHLTEHGTRPELEKRIPNGPEFRSSIGPKLSPEGIDREKLSPTRHALRFCWRYRYPREARSSWPTPVRQSPPPRMIRPTAQRSAAWRGEPTTMVNDTERRSCLCGWRGRGCRPKSTLPTQARCVQHL
jgi:hypothetical protein